MRIIFMGTPEFAIPSLDILVKQGYEIAAVVTAPDKPAGRGRKLQPSPVKTYAEEQGLPLLQPEKLRDPDFLAALQALQAYLMVVVAFRMLPKAVWSLPAKGTFNLHSSLLPDYRGAAPINWAIINGETRSGVTTFLIDEAIDTGNLLLQESVEIPYDWTAGDLHDDLMQRGAALVLQTVQGLEAGTLQAKPQDDTLARHHAPKLFRDDCRIDWHAPGPQVCNHIRGLSPYPTAWTLLNGKVLKLFRASLGAACGVPPGTAAISPDSTYLRIATASHWLEVSELQIEGKRRMSVRDFLHGFQEPLDAVE